MLIELLTITISAITKTIIKITDGKNSQNSLQPHLADFSKKPKLADYVQQ